MAYLRIASGYRPGGPNVPGPDIPASVAADTLIDSEVGLKSTWLAHRLRVNAAAYQINWKNLQIVEVAPAPIDISYGANGHTAKVRGFEAATTFAASRPLQLGLTLNYTHAALSAPMPVNSSLVGNRGDRLPYTPIWSAALTADYTLLLKDGWTGVLGGGWHYVGQRYTTFTNPGNCPLNCAGASTPPDLRPYGVFDLHAGVSDDSWNVRFSVRNLTNKYVLVDMNGGGGPPFDVAPITATVLSGRLFTLGVDHSL
jgi:outer membrane receptor protein involved in Fe transport